MGNFVGRILAGAIVVGAIIALTMLVSPANAQVQKCGPHETLDRALREKHSEEVIWTGADQQGAVTLYVSASGTWTIIATRIGGAMSCMVAAGKHWRSPKNIPLTPAGELN